MKSHVQDILDGARLSSIYISSLKGLNPKKTHFCTENGFGNVSLFGRTWAELGGLAWTCLDFESIRRDKFPLTPETIYDQLVQGINYSQVKLQEETERSEYLYILSYRPQTQKNTLLH